MASSTFNLQQLISGPNQIAHPPPDMQKNAKSQAAQGLMMLNIKKCNKCGCHKPIDEFAKNARNKSGYLPKCKVCHAAYQKEYRTVCKRRLLMNAPYESPTPKRIRQVAQIDQHAAAAAARINVVEAPSPPSDSCFSNNNKTGPSNTLIKTKAETIYCVLKKQFLESWNQNGSIDSCALDVLKKVKPLVESINEKSIEEYTTQRTEVAKKKCSEIMKVAEAKCAEIMKANEIECNSFKSNLHSAAGTKQNNIFKNLCAYFSTLEEARQQ
eukprot:jgi/Bigna1/69844/fgenesh1_pg.10_\